MLKIVKKTLLFLTKIASSILKATEKAMKTLSKFSNFAKRKLNGIIKKENKEYIKTQKEYEDLKEQQSQVNAKIEANKMLKENLAKEEMEQKIKKTQQKKLTSGLKLITYGILKTGAVFLKHSTKLLGSTVKIARIGLDKGVEVVNNKTKKQKDENKNKNVNKELQKLSVVVSEQDQNIVVNSAKQKSKEKQLY